MPKANFLSYFTSEAAMISLQIERFSMIKSKKISFLSYPTPPQRLHRAQPPPPRRLHRAQPTPPRGDYTGIKQSSPYFFPVR